MTRAILRAPGTWQSAAAYAAGAAAPLLAVAAWQAFLWRPAAGSVWHALWGFRLEATNELARDIDGAAALLAPAVASGLALVLVWAARGLIAFNGRLSVRAALFGWLAGAVAGVLAGGSYWPHYLIQVVPFAAIVGGIALARAPRRAAMATAAVLAALALGGATVSAVATRTVPYQQSALTVSEFLRSNAERTDTLHVIYARANLLYHSGLHSPFPYQWSLMIRAFPDAENDLRRLLVSQQRPTWLVGWQPFDAWGLDRDGRLRETVDRLYVHVADVCGRPVYLRRDVQRPVAHRRIDSPCSRTNSIFALRPPAITSPTAGAAERVWLPGRQGSSHVASSQAGFSDRPHHGEHNPIDPPRRTT